MNLKKYIPKLSVNELITNLLRKKLEKRKRKQELVSKYGKWWSKVIFLIFLLGCIGAYNDGAVIFGMAQSTSTPFWKSIIYACLIAAIIQYCIGENVALYTESKLKSKKELSYQTSGYKFMRVLFISLTVIGISFSLFLNRKSTFSAQTFSDTPPLVNLDSIKAIYKKELMIRDTIYQQDLQLIEQNFAAPILSITAAKEQFESEAKKNVSEYRNLGRKSDAAYVSQKYTNKGKDFGVKISNAQTSKAEAIKALMRDNKNRIKYIETQRDTALSKAERLNTSTLSNHSNNIDVFAYIIEAINWFANLGKVGLVAAYHFFLFYAEEEETIAREAAMTEKQKAERDAKERADRLAREKAEQERADRLAREKAEQERADRLAREKEEQERADRLAREKAEQEAKSGRNSGIFSDVPISAPTKKRKPKSGKTQKSEDSKEAVKRAYLKLSESGKPKQKDIAEITGLSTRTIRKYEKELRGEGAI